MPLAVSSVAPVSNRRCHLCPVTDTPPLASRSIAVNAKPSVLPSFQPRRENTPISDLISWSVLISNLQCSGAAYVRHAKCGYTAVRPGRPFQLPPGEGIVVEPRIPNALSPTIVCSDAERHCG